jgi:hypothetical protein
MTTLAHLQGWYEQNTEGIGTVYFAIIDEGLLTRVTDTPSATAFPPRIRNPETFSIRRMATFWPWGDTQEAMAAVGDLEIDNYDGAYDFLLTADLRDAPAVFKIVPAGMLAAANTVANGLVVATVLIDDISCSTEDVIRIRFKDTLARLDAPLPVRYNPPFVDSNAANRMVPLSFGACRNVAPLLIAEDGVDGSGEPLYQLHDRALANIAQTRDMGAILDVYADPPQVIPALNRSGIQLHALPEGKLLCDISNVGTQAIAAGAVDVLNGAGLLTTWPVSGSPPTGWTYGGTGTNSRVGTPNYPQDYCMNMSTTHQYTSVDDALYAYVTTPFLAPGQTYRIKFTLDRMTAPTGTVLTGGFMVRTDLGLGNDGAVSSSYLGPYLQAPIFGSQQYTFEYTVPNDGTTRTLYMIMVGTGASNPAWTCAWHGLTVELLGGFEEAPLSSITLEDYYTEILYLRAYEDTSAWDATSLQAIDAATDYGFGIHFDSAPNILRDCLLGPLPSYCADLATNADGQLYAFQLVDPKLQTPVAGFDLTNTERPIAISPDRASYLTTVMGARRNWTISGPADFVTDYALVPADVRMRYGRTSQYQVTASKTPAGQYAHAIGAPVFDSLLDDPDDAQTEIDRVVGLYAPVVYDDGTVFNGKRQFVTFTVYFDDAGVLGDQTFGALTAPGLLLGSTVELTYSHSNGVMMFDQTPVFVCGTELFPFGNKITIMGWY